MRPVHIAMALILLCGVAAWQVAQIPESAMQMTVGPSLMPALVVAGLALLAACYGLSALRGRQADESHASGQSPQPGATGRLLSLLCGGALFATLIGPLGFIVPATLCGMAVARAFDAPLGRQSLLICATIASCFWLLFGRVLGVELGPALPWPF